MKFDMTKNILNISLWENNPQKDRTSYVVKIDFAFPCSWTTISIEELKEILRLWIIAEERRYPPSLGFKGRMLLLEEITKIFHNGNKVIEEPQRPTNNLMDMF